MRSFIKAHRKSSSLGRSKTNETVTNSNTSQYSTKPSLTNNDTVNTTKLSYDRRASDIIPRISLNGGESENETLDFVPTTPHKSNSSQEQGSPSISSPNFESFHKLASKTKLTSKLFNKNSTASIPQGLQQQEQPFMTSNSTSASSSPTRKAKGTFEVLPTIKGTITHSWGDHHSSSPIINLNNSFDNQDPVNERRISPDSWDPTFVTSPTTNYFFEKEQEQDDENKSSNKSVHTIKKTETYNIELDPAFKVSRPIHFPNNTHVESYVSLNDLHTNETVDVNRVILKPGKNQSVDTLQSTDSERYGNISRNKIKNKNRKIKIHSSGDLLTLQKGSKSLETPPLSIPSLPKFEIQESTPKKIPENNNSDIEDDHSKVSKDTNHLTFGSDSDSDESKFSFEYSTINGRTSSVKYYKTPGETNEEEVEQDREKPSIYLDDFYAEDGLDDDMNYIDESYDHISDYNNNNDLGIDSVKLQNKQTGNVKKYDDLFELSDEQDEPMDDDYPEQDSVVPLQKDIIVGSHKLIKLEDSTSDNAYVRNSNNLTDLNKTKKLVTKYNDLFDISDGELSSINSHENEVIKEPISAPANKNGKPKLIMKYNDLFDLSDSDEDRSNQIYSDNLSNSIPYYKKEDDLKEGPEKLVNNRSKLNNSKLPFLAVDLLNPQNHKLPVLNENTQFIDFMSPPRLDHLHTSSPNKSKIPNILLSPMDSDTGTELTVDLRTPKEHLLKLSPVSLTPNENSPVHSHLPPPARSQSLKFHDLNSDMDSEIPGLTSNLFFIDEAEEDEYNTNLKNHNTETTNTSEIEGEESYSDYLDEINTVPEDFEFSDGDEYQLETLSEKHFSKGLPFSSRKSPLGTRESFRRTHSYHNKPLGISRENTPMKNTLELDNKTVTFFNSSWEAASNNIEPSRESSIKRSINSLSPNPIIHETNEENTSTYYAPSPSYVRSSTYSLSPIQEAASNTSAPASPKVKQHNT